MPDLKEPPSLQQKNSDTTNDPLQPYYFVNLNLLVPVRPPIDANTLESPAEHQEKSIPSRLSLHPLPPNISVFVDIIHHHSFLSTIHIADHYTLVAILQKIVKKAKELYANLPHLHSLQKPRLQPTQINDQPSSNMQSFNNAFNYWKPDTPNNCFPTPPHFLPSFQPSPFPFPFTSPSSVAFPVDPFALAGNRDAAFSNINPINNILYNSPPPPTDRIRAAQVLRDILHHPHASPTEPSK